MLDTSKGKIFLAAERGHTETEWFRSYNTFNFGNYQSENKKPFGGLYVLNEDTLAGKKSISLLVEEEADIILLPIVGAITYTDSKGNTALIEAGQVLLYTATKGTTLHIENPYENELINFLQLWMHKAEKVKNIGGLFSFDLEKNRDRLIALFPPNADWKFSAPTFPKAFIGKFGGRTEAIYKLSQPGNGLFVFVIEGAFEVQYRLLEAKDGLALWNVAEVEWEALSNEAILLILEIPLGEVQK